MSDSWLIAVACASPWVSNPGGIIWPDDTYILDRPEKAKP